MGEIERDEDTDERISLPKDEEGEIDEDFGCDGTVSEHSS